MFIPYYPVSTEVRTSLLSINNDPCDHEIIGPTMKLLLVAHYTCQRVLIQTDELAGRVVICSVSMESQSKVKESSNMDVSDIHVCNGMAVHRAFIGQLSPIKISRTNADVKYFDGFFSASIS